MSRTVQQWEHLATEALHRLLLERGALVRPEAEAILGETTWVRDTLRLSQDLRPQPHHVTTARTRLARSGDLTHRTERLNNRDVPVWVDAHALSTRGRKTEVSRAEAAKRRLYRTYLGWTSNTMLCGHAAEQVVYASMNSRAGRELWLANGQPGNFNTIGDKELSLGPLDAGGYWLRERSNPPAGVIPFAVEIKNMRKWIYPWDSELWGLLAKLSDFPMVIPILVARRIHHITFKFFKAIGAIGHETKRQWFTSPGILPTQRHYLSQERLYRVTSELSLRDTVFLDDPATPQPSIVKFFSETPFRQVEEHTLAARSLKNWAQAAPIVKKHIDLRNKLQSWDRQEIWTRFLEASKTSGLDTYGWGRFH